MRVVLGLAHQRLLGEISRFSVIASRAFVSQSEPCLNSPSAWSRSRFSSAIAVASLLLGFDELRPHVGDDLIQHLLGIFGPRDQVKLMFDRSRADRRSKRPMVSVPRDTCRSRADATRERHGDALVRGEELVVVEIRQLQCFRHDDRIVLDAVRSVQQVGRVQLEQAATRRGERLGLRGQRHDLHAHQQHDGRREVHHHVEIQLAARPHDPEARLDLDGAAPSAPSRSRRPSISSFVTIVESCCR